MSDFSIAGAKVSRIHRILRLAEFEFAGEKIAMHILQNVIFSRYPPVKCHLSIPTT
jgi:hypothetical protein